ncbi:putative ABC transporter ATP-binding protein [Methanocorpusculaceae archaeon Sp1]|nr:putative ABC transporter ATP-binding protein [Methanocorpusculaceae archaeon Sp1]
MNHIVERLSKSIREYKRDSLLAPVFVALEVVMEVLIPLIIAGLIDDGITGGSMPIIVKLGLTLLLFAIMALVFGVLAGKYAASASAGFARNLRHDIFHNIQNFSFANIDKYSTASLITRMTTDVTNVQNAYQMIIRVAIRCPLMLVFSFLMVVGINAELSLIFLVLLPILGVGMYLIITKAHPLFELVFKTYDHLNKVVRENLRGIRVVKSYVREDYETRKFRDVSTTIYGYFSSAEKLLAFTSPLMQAIIYASILLISWFGAQFIVLGNLSTGELVSLIAYTMQILMSLMMLAMVFVMITMARASAKRITEVLDEEIDLKNPDSPVYEVADGSVEFQNVSFSYTKDQNRLALKNISLKITSGETIGILGGTGSSKSTLVQLIPRLYDATDGAVFVGGRDVREYDIAALRNAVAMVLQKNILFAGTIRDNLRWGNRDATEEEIVHACRLSHADEFVSSLPEAYDTHVEQGGSNFSGGQKQRLCIARALLKKPKILILDDSTSAVDTKTDSLIRAAFRTELPATTKIIIAQRISSIQDADRILVLDEGRITAEGTHAELLEKDPVYREMYHSQQKGGEE